MHLHMHVVKIIQRNKTLVID